MKCPSCGVDGTSNYCKNCGSRISVTVSLPNTRNFKQWFADLWDLGRKKNLLEGVIVSGIIGISLYLLLITVAALIPEIFLAEGSNTHLWLFVVLSVGLSMMIAKIKGLMSEVGIWGIILLIAVCVYLFGILYGIWALVIILMYDNRTTGLSAQDVERRSFISGELLRGFMWWIIGGAATWFGLVNAGEDETFTIWYGATFWGMFIVTRALYWYAVPGALSDDRLNQAKVGSGQQGELSAEERVTIRKKVNRGFWKFLLYGVLGFFALIFLIAIFSS